MSMKKAGILTIVILILAAAGMLLSFSQKNLRDTRELEEQGTLVKENADERYPLC